MAKSHGPSAWPESDRKHGGKKYRGYCSCGFQSAAFPTVAQAQAAASACPRKQASAGGAS